MQTLTGVDIYLPRLERALGLQRRHWADLNDGGRRLLGKAILANWQDCTRVGLDAEARRLITEDAQHGVGPLGEEEQP